MKPKKISSKLKKIRRTYNELRLICSYDMKPLEKRMFIGFWRSFKVREDVLRSSYGSEVQKVVEACNTFWLGKTKAAKSYERAAINLAIQNKEQTFREMRYEELKELNFSESFIRKWFRTETRVQFSRNKDISYTCYIPKIDPHMVEFRYTREYINEIRVPVGDAISQETFLRNYLKKNNGYNLLLRRFREEREANLTKKKIISRLLDEEIKLASLESDDTSSA
jgi:hypothetical protein